MCSAKAALSIFLMVALFASLGTAADKATSERIFKASLSGSEEVPMIRTEAKGEATFQVSKDGDFVNYRLTVSNIKDVIAAYIQKGKKAENGPPVLNLFTEPRREDVSGALLAEGKVEPYLLTGPLKGRSLHSLIQLMKAGEAYVNILTEKHPDGEIRGQIQ